jgi:CRP/FNR family cyclic AMP-dependent transcriptional regulator
VFIRKKPKKYYNKYMKATLTPLKHLLEGAREKRCEAGQIIFYVGDEASDLHILTSGIIKVYDIDEKGQEKILQLIKAPAILPLGALFSAPQPISWYYASLTDITVSLFSVDGFYEQIKQHPDLNAYITNWLAAETHELLVRVDSMNKTEAKDKLLSILKFLRVYYAEPERRGWQRIEFPVTHQFLADMAGLARESVSIQMSQLQKKRIVRSKRPFIEINRERLINS